MLRAGERTARDQRTPDVLPQRSTAPGVEFFVALDATGKGSCSLAHQAELDAAIAFIRSRYGDIGWSPTDCVPNGPESACMDEMPDPTACWGGVPFIFPSGMNPLEEQALQVLYRAPALRIRGTLERADLELVIHCRNRFWIHDSTRWCRPGKQVAGFTTCQNFSNTKKHINICEWYLDRVVCGDQAPEQLARVIVHEMFHAWGANEAAAAAMGRNTGWRTPTA